MEGLALIVPRRHAGVTRDQRRAIVPDLPFALDAKDSSKATMLHESPGWSGLGKLARGRALVSGRVPNMPFKPIATGGTTPPSNGTRSPTGWRGR
jgi:hypothetical protein